MKDPDKETLDYIQLSENKLNSTWDNKEDKDYDKFLPSMTLDHIFICVDQGAPEAELLKEFGLREGSSNTHPGQGTANRRFFFENFMLELLFIKDKKELQSDLTKPTSLYERLTDKSTCPFGISFRGEVDFKIWQYKPIYLPKDLSIDIAETVLDEPMFFTIPFGANPVDYPKEKKEPLEHKIKLQKITNVKIYLAKDNELSETSKIVNNEKNISIEKSNRDLLELEFDNGIRKKEKSFYPTLPLTIKY